MNDQDVDRSLQGRAYRQDPDPRLTAAIADSVRSSLKPMRPLQSSSRLALILLAVCAALATVLATASGLDGVRVQTAIARTLLPIALGVLGWLTALETARQTTPGSRHALRAGMLPAVVFVTLLGVYAVLFHDYSIDHALSAGPRCLAVGLLVAIAALLLVGLILRRGKICDGTRAGAALGTLCGLAGVGLLSLHCPDLQVRHLLWHALVPLVSGMGGALIGSIAVPGSRHILER